MTATNHTIKNIAQARRSKAWREAIDASLKADRYFFTPDSMNFHHSVLVGIPYTLPYDTRAFFVTGDRNFEDKRRYTVRVIDKNTGKIAAVSEMFEYGTPMEAVAARNAIVGYE